MNYVNILNKIIRIVRNASDKNWIVIGDNSIGKSEVLSKIVFSLKENCYYIDSVNRSFNIKNINLSKDKLNFNIIYKEIVNTRLEKDFYNIKDSFGKNDHIERLYPLYQESLKILLKDFLGASFIFEREQFGDDFGDGEVTIKIDNQKVELSSGYQAIIRLFSELIVFNEQINEKAVVVIDEIDEFLSPKNASKILNYLINQFPKNKFIVSTHSSDLIASCNDASIIALEKEDFSLLDSNDFSTLTEVNTLFGKIFQSNQLDKNSAIDTELQRLLDLKIMDCWTEDEEKELIKISFDQLTGTEKLIYKQIQEW